MSGRDERALIVDALRSAGLLHQLDPVQPVAVLTAASSELPEGTQLVVDAPLGWLRLGNRLPVRGEVPWGAIHGLNRAYVETGFCHAHYDPHWSGYRLSVSLQAVHTAPAGEAILDAVEHLLRLRRKLLTGQGELRWGPGPQAADGRSPTLAAAVAALGESLAFVADERGGHIGGLEVQGSERKLGMRVHSVSEKIFAFDAWRMPPGRSPIDEALVRSIEAVNAELDAGALIAFRDGFVVYRWACPYRWLRIEDLRSPALAGQAVRAFDSL